MKSAFVLVAWAFGLSAVLAEPEAPESISGTLQVGKSQSVILYFGEESGDYAGYCFANDSEPGKKILAAIKDGGKCEITGKIDYEKACKVPGLEVDLSAAGAIVAVKSVKAVGEKAPVAKPAANAVAEPEARIAKLYELAKTNKGPFYQTKDKAAMEKWLTKDLAALIHKDAVASQDEVGVLDFDPLYNAQDTEITEFKLKSEKAGDATHVIATFKNFDKADTIRFVMEQSADKSWKIADIRFKDNSSLKKMLQEGVE